MINIPKKKAFQVLFAAYAIVFALALVRTLLWSAGLSDHRPEFNSDFLFLTITFVSMTAVGAYLNTMRLKDEVYWITNVLQAQYLERKRAEDATLSNEGVPQAESGKRWPWGHHHTEMLGHLEAAGKRYWMNYDPNDISTAPTNTMVADWLQSERGVSNDKAKAIASILRPEGLRTGPR